MDTTQTQSSTTEDPNSTSNIFAKYNKQFSGNNGGYDDQQVETMAAFGRNYAAVKGTQGDPTIARAMVNGRHELSNSILNGFATAGAKPDTQTMKDLDELDNLAQASHAISRMDNETRAGMSIRGVKGMDPFEIDRRESEIAKRVYDRNRNVLLEDENLNRVIKRGLAEKGNMVNQDDKITLSHKIALDKAMSATENMTANELKKTIDTGGIQGHSRDVLVSIYTNKVTNEINMRTLSNQLNPTNAGSFNNNPFGDNIFTNPTGNGAAGSSSGGDGGNPNQPTTPGQVSSNATGIATQQKMRIAALSNLSMDVLGRMSEEVKQSALPDPVTGKTNVIVPFTFYPGTKMPVSGEELTQVISQKQENINKLGESRAKSIEVQGGLIANKVLGSREVFFNSLHAMGMGSITESNSPVNMKINNVQNQIADALNKGDVNAAQELANKAQIMMDSTIKDLISSAKPELQAGLTDIATFGKFVFGETAAKHLAYSSPGAIIDGTKDDEVLREVGAYVGQMNANINAPVIPVNQQTSRRGNVDLGAITGGASSKLIGNDFTDAANEKFMNAVNANSMRTIAVGAAQKSVVTNGIYETLTSVIDGLNKEVTDSANANKGVEDPKALELLDLATHARDAMFGRVHQQRQIQPVIGGMQVTGEEAFTETDSHGNEVQLKDEAGNPVTHEIIDPNAIGNYLIGVQNYMDKVSPGKIDLMNGVIESFKQVANDKSSTFSAGNPIKKALLVGISPPYRNNQSVDDKMAMTEIYGIASINAVDGFRKMLVANNVPKSDAGQDYQNKVNDTLHGQSVRTGDNYMDIFAMDNNQIKAYREQQQRNAKFNSVTSTPVQNSNSASSSDPVIDWYSNFN
jgi:hypothetical protein